MRAAMDPTIKENKDRAITAGILSLPEYGAAELLLCYYPVRSEIDLRPLMERAAAEGKRVALPVCRDGQMHFHLYTGELCEGSFGIPEPTGRRVETNERTLAILPGYAYVGRRRLGYGGGYYDRFLADFHGVSVFACYEGFTAQMPTAEHDKPFDILITEGKN